MTWQRVQLTCAGGQGRAPVQGGVAGDVRADVVRRCQALQQGDEARNSRSARSWYHDSIGTPLSNWYLKTCARAGWFPLGSRGRYAGFRALPQRR